MKEYKLVTIKDIFDKVPADKIEECLKELAVGMTQAKHLEAAMLEAANTISGESFIKAFDWPETATWIDDGKGEITTNVILDDEEICKVKTKMDSNGRQ
jgi:hypothetical protein